MPKEVDRWEDEPQASDIDGVEWEEDRWVPVESDRHRNDPRVAKDTILREIRYIWKMRGRGKTQQWIADEMGMSQPWVAKRIRQSFDLYAPGGIDEERIIGVMRCEEEYEDVREALRAAEIDLKDAMAAMDRIERRKADLLGTRAPKQISVTDGRRKSSGVTPEIQKIQEGEAQRRADVEKEWKKKRKQRDDD